MKRFLAGIPLAILVVTAMASPIQAQVKSFGGKLQVTGGLNLGLAGDAGLKINGNKIADQDMDATVGLNFVALYEVFRYIDVGGSFGFLFWRTDDFKKASIDRLSWVEIDFLLRAKYGFLRDTLHIYLAMPIGLTISVPNKDFKNKAVAGTKTGAGVNLSLMAGLNYQFWQGLGAFFELGWVFHYVNHKATGGLELEATIHQMAMNFGVFYRF